MTDAELIARMRSTGCAWSVTEAADRIEALIAEHEEDQSVIAVWRGRAQRAEAEVERLTRERDEARTKVARLTQRLQTRYVAPLETSHDVIDQRNAMVKAAEAKVERLRGLLRRAGAALWETGVDHPVLQDIDDALPPGWAAQATEDTT